MEVNREHEKKGEQECANWRLSAVMDGSHIIGGSGLLWALRSFKYSVHRTPNFFHNDHLNSCVFERAAETR